MEKKDKANTAMDGHSEKMRKITGDLPRGLLRAGILVLTVICIALVLFFVLVLLPQGSGCIL